ncbi:immunity protein YezG family protein [Pseudomonas schmalbachii]|uniref:DUF600 family protein n=1 Tax=Pseudomonas schmalbachii TaxID=2816993 RepID=A0ABS3TQ21_9PSED|nr:immunity protein YezG family protein [Pseudomonas schmalbachii]MBO3275764.1 DUF600 family protein [Pseudomonas schmalbachii]
MSSQQEYLQQKIATSIYSIVKNEKWASVKLKIKIIKQYLEAEAEAESIDQSGKTKSLRGYAESIELAKTLRSLMTKTNYQSDAWYTLTFELTSDGNFNFNYDYDHLPSFETIPSPDKWRAEFLEHPRPDLEIHLKEWLDGSIDYSDEKEEGYKTLIKRLADLQNK